MTTFISGGTSSIGRVLIRELSRRGEKMRVLVRSSSRRDGLNLPGVEFIEGDVTDPDSVLRAMQGCERVDHLAAVVGGKASEDEWHRVNVEGTRHVLAAARSLGVGSMVQVSSLSVLGHTEPGECADETRPIRTELHTNLYQKTKFAADEIAREYAANGLNVKLVYPGFGFGCSFASSHQSMQEQTLLRMASGQPVAIMGSGKNQLLLAYYNDTAAGICLAHERGQSGRGYILGNENLTFPQIWQVIADLLHQPMPRRRIPLAVLKNISVVTQLLRGEAVFPQDFLDMVGLNWCFSNARAKSELGWQPLTFADAIQKTWEAYQQIGWTSQANE
jgi:Nucleoside-diphosphate-sugar epimerases